MKSKYLRRFSVVPGKLLKFESQKNDDVDRVDDVEAAGVDGDEHLGVMVDYEGGERSGRRLDLTMEEGAPVVGQRPTELKILPD